MAAEAKTSEGRRRRRTLQGKLIGLVVTSVGIAVLLVTAASALKDGRREAQLEAARLEAEAQVLASMSLEAAQAQDVGRGYAALRAISHMPGVVYGRIERADGSVLVETGAGARLTRDTDGAGGSWLGALQSRSTRATAPILQARRPVGRVVLLSRGEGVAGRLAASVMASLLASAAATAIGLLIAWRLQRRIAAPVTALTAAMEEVQARHDYGRSVEVDADDEVADLVSGFNRMLAEIRTRDARIAQQVEGLEDEVAVRTAELRVAKGAAEDANRAKSDFLAAMSHEIRTPMNGVMVMAEMLASSDLPPKPRRFAQVIAKSGAGLVGIINDILDVSKIEAGKLELEAGEVDLCELAEDVAALFWDRASAKGLDLAVYVDPALPRRVAGDPTRLRQVLTNLVSNAVKFTDAGGVLIEVEPRAAPVGQGVRVAVRDTGLGVDPKKLPLLFEAFTQADQSTTRRFGGTGLGLNICKRLVEAMGGRFDVASTPGRGSCFAFELPLAALAPEDAAPPDLSGARVEVDHAGVATRRALRRHLARCNARPAVQGEDTGLRFADPAAAAAAAPEPGQALVCLAAYSDAEGARLVDEGRAQAVLLQPFRRADLYAILAQAAAGAPVTSPQETARPLADAHPTFSSARVLVADDSPMNREVAVEALARLGVVPAVVQDGREAVDAVRGGDFDLVLMDGSMPVLDGFDAAREIRAMEGSAGRTPVIALTAHVLGPAADAWREAGMDGALRKPFTLADLAGVLGRFLKPDPPGAVREMELIDPQAVAQLEALAVGAPAGFVERVRRLFADNAPACVERIAAAAAAGDAAETVAGAHALKSMCQSVGALALSRMVEDLEAAAREGVAAHPLAVAPLRNVLARTLARLTPGDGDPDAGLAAELALALDRGDELALVYQPQFDRTGREITGVEALVRWPRPGREPCGAERLARAAERFGLVGRLTDWVAERAMRDLGPMPGVKVAVNGSALDFADPAFPARIARLLEKTGFDPARFEVEITETAVVHDEETVFRVMEAIRAQGVQIALDDFGAGYSSLRYLRVFPFGKVKIDRQFITDCQSSLQSAAIVHAVVAIGRALGMKVVAEGVETQTECDFLRSAGVHAFQGYLFCRPVTVEALARLVAEQAGRRAA